MSSQAPSVGLSAPSVTAATSSWTHTPRDYLHAYDLESEDTMRQFLMSHPDQVNELARVTRRLPTNQPKGIGNTLLYHAVSENLSLSFISWLVDMGADVNLCGGRGILPVQAARSLAILNFLLERGADPAWMDEDDEEDEDYVDYRTTLHHHSRRLNKDCIERLLQEPSVIETINDQDGWWKTALFVACETEREDATPNERLKIIEMLLFAGADPTIKDYYEKATPLEILRKEHPDNHAAIALLELFLFMSPRGYYLNKARHIMATHHALTRATPSYLQPRMPPLPRVDLVAPPPSQDEEGDDEEEVETRMAVLRHVLDVDEDGAPGKGLLGELFTELIELMGPEKDFYFLEEDEEEEEETGKGGDDGEEEGEEEDEEEEEEEDEEEDDDDGGGVSRYSLRSSSGGASKYALRSSKRKMQG